MRLMAVMLGVAVVAAKPVTVSVDVNDVRAEIPRTLYGFEETLPPQVIPHSSSCQAVFLHHSPTCETMQLKRS